MDDLLTRGILMAPLGVLLPLGIPVLRANRVARGAVAAGLVAAALAIHHDDWQSWVLVGATLMLAITMPEPYYVRRRWVPVLAALALAALTVVIADLDVAGRAVTSLAEDRDLVLVAAGALFAVFVGGALIGHLLHPFASKVDSAPRGMEDAGRYIGWLERSLLYALILVGAPEAGALVIAAKSVARFPSFTREDFAEYYLIGSLLSLLVVLATGLGVRAALGLPMRA